MFSLSKNIDLSDLFPLDNDLEQKNFGDLPDEMEF
jgi:hypothetical protein